MKPRLIARDPKRGGKAAAQLKASGANAHAVRLDITVETTIEEAAHRVKREFRGRDAPVNNASIGPNRVPPGQLSRGTRRNTFKTNVFGAVSSRGRFRPCSANSRRAA